MLKLHSRRLSLIAAATSLAISAAPGYLFAQVAEPDTSIKEVENSRFSTSGLIVSNSVFVRCGPGENYYATMKLDKGAKVKVVGAKFDWLKVTPPEGSFCYVARLYVDRHGDGKVGRVIKDSINVRAGSTLSALKIGILCELSQGEEVEILGEEQEYFKIKPPAKAYLYINKKFVEPDPDAKPEVQVAKADAPVVEPTKPETARGADVGGTGDFPGGEGPKADPTKADPAKPDPTKPELIKPETGDVGGKPDPTKPDPIPGNDLTKTDPIKPDGGNETVKPDPTKTDPAKIDPTKTDPPKVDPLSTPEGAEAAFDKAESAFLAAKTQPLEEQPIDALLKQFEAVSKNDALPESMRRVAESRVATLKVRASAQVELVKVRQGQSDLKQRQMALEAEQQELQKRIAEKDVKVYTAVGTLQPSSLQQGAVTLYRLTDPATGRTVCYLRSNDAKTLKLIGQFVGVRGALQEESRLGAKVITPTELTACDPGKVHLSITAQIIPPSLMPKEPAQAQTDPQPQP
jgi:uncharacterized protein YgiM (DUF1202 family)